MKKSVFKVFGAVALVSGLALAGLSTAGLAPGSMIAPAAAQSGSATAVSRLKVSELEGTWIEPVTESDDGTVITRGSENVVVIGADGRFSDALEIEFQFRGNPQFDGLYLFKSEGRVSIASEQITWAVDKAWVVPVIPDDASAAKRDAMTYLGKELSQGMRETETYPIVSYDGNQLVMDAGSYDKFTEYVMTRR